MKLREYAAHIAALAKAHPDADVVYSADDEGNNFQQVYYAPSVGRFTHREFEQTTDNPNAVCIN